MVKCRVLYKCIVSEKKDPPKTHNVTVYLLSHQRWEESWNGFATVITPQDAKLTNQGDTCHTQHPPPKKGLAVTLFE